MFGLSSAITMSLGYEGHPGGPCFQLTNTIASAPLRSWVAFSIKDSQEDCSQLSSHLPAKGRSREKRRVGSTVQKWFMYNNFSCDVAIHFGYRVILEAVYCVLNPLLCS